MSLRPAPSKPDPLRLAQRVAGIEPFWVMECAKAADAIARTPACDPAQGGERMLYLNIGEPDETAPPAVVAAAQACLDAGRTQYTHAVGLPALRRALSGWYASRWGVEVDPGRIVVTAGASAALQLLCTALVEPGDEFLMPDPCYPCNRHFVTASGGTARLLPTTPAQRFQLDATSVADAWGPATRGVMLASPSNPTGTSVPAETLAGIVEVVRARGGITIVDEIYLGLSYDGDARTALALGDDVLVVNSFSKYFGMTGWRLGWLVLPEALVAPVEKLAQNLYICASAIAQHARDAGRVRGAPRHDEGPPRLHRARAGRTGPDGAGAAGRGVLRLVRRHRPRARQLAVLLRHDGACPRRAHPGPRLRPRRDGPLRAPVLRQLHGRSARGRATPATRAGALTTSGPAQRPCP